MSDNAVSPSLFRSLAGWTKALRWWLQSLADVDESGFTADRLPRAEDIEFHKYGPQRPPASTGRLTRRETASTSQDHSPRDHYRKPSSCSNSSIH
ncbi:MAG: hypothetical protein ABSA66_14085 [Roseiarcus sp.]|jgi:hypothetical protein